MKRIKVINEPTELVPMLRAVDTSVKRQVFLEVSNGWCTAKQIEEKYGEEGKEALAFFEKMKLVESMWQSTGERSQEKAYHTYYMSFHINTSCPVTEISDILAIAVMSNKEFDNLEKEIYELIGEEGMFAGDVSEKQSISPIMLKSVVKRSTKLEYRGHRVERIKD
ncbi:MAG: ArsR family transcriptional regulator [bacterium]|nr:MAG: ArsR family transcriptional regulator [bacterium]